MERYFSHLSGVSGIKLCPPQKDVEPNYAYFPVVFDGFGADRDEVFQKLKEILNAESVEINMCNNKFIDFVASDYPQKEFEVMIPESRLDEFIKGNKELRQLSYRTLIHKHFFENIDDRFPYQQLTLQQIGIPAFDVLQVSTENGVSYVELSGDAY